MRRGGWTLLRSAAKAFGIAALAIGATLIATVPIAGWFLFGEGRFMGTTFTPAAWAQAGSCAGLTDWK